jgi:DNA-binding MarR family transcriptional regulator
VRVDGEDEVRWLAPAEMRAWLSYLAGSTLLEGALDRQLQRDSGMPHAYYQILVVLQNAPDRTLRMTDLANLLHSSQSRLSHAVNKLERNGWVCRSPCLDDRRGTLATLTDRGVDALAEAAPGHVRIVREALFDRLTPEQVDQLAAIWGSVLDGLQPGRPAEISLPDAVRRGVDASG